MTIRAKKVGPAFIKITLAVAALLYAAPFPTEAQPDAKFTPEDAASLRGQSFGLSWTVVGPATYQSACTVVTLD